MHSMSTINMKNKIHSLAHFIGNDSRDYGILGTESFLSVRLIFYDFIYFFLSL